VLLISTAAGLGGVERIVTVLARELSQRDVPVRAVFPDTEGGRTVVQWAEGEGVTAEVHAAVREVHTRRSAADVIRLARFVRTSRAGVANIHYGVNHISAKDVLAVRLALRRCVVTVHHAVPFRSRRTRALTVFAARLANEVVVVSNAVRDLLRDAGVPARRITVIPNGLPVPVDRSTAAELRLRIGVPVHATVIGTLGRLVPEKGVDDLIEAVAGVVIDGDRPYLLIAGDGPARAELERLATDRLGDHVRFLGRVPDADDLYAACDVFALPSHEEGFGLVYIEAALHGIPGVGARVGGVPEAIEDGVTGHLVEPGDRAALTHVLTRLCRDPTARRQLGRAARERALARFSAPVMAARYLEVLAPPSRRSRRR
jgi:glycosyltransferase involved in cell wall biosynthesis